MSVYRPFSGAGKRRETGQRPLTQEDEMSRYIRIYESMCPADRISIRDTRRAAIIAEMRAIRRAGTAAEAARVIAWWCEWPNERHETAEDFCREARKMMRACSAKKKARPS
jgi:hypothetical protein